MQYHSLLLPAAVAVASLAPAAHALTAYSSGDPSLAGTVLAEVDGGAFYSSTGLPPLPGEMYPLLADIDEKVVQNAGGTLDFYYRFSDFSGAGTSPLWLEIQQINECSLSLGYIADGPGDIAPSGGVTGPLQDIGPIYYPPLYAAFDISSNNGSSATLSTTWLLLRTNATSYVTGDPNEILFLQEPTAQTVYFAESPIIGDSPPTPATQFFLPAAAPSVPEPGTAILLVVPLAVLAIRFRSLPMCHRHARR